MGYNSFNSNRCSLFRYDQNDGWKERRNQGASTKSDRVKNYLKPKSALKSAFWFKMLDFFPFFAIIYITLKQSKDMLTSLIDIITVIVFVIVLVIAFIECIPLYGDVLDILRASAYGF